MFCDQCGNTIENGARFCMQCGATLHTSAEQICSPSRSAESQLYKPAHLVYLFQSKFSDEEERIDGNNVYLAFQKHALLVTSQTQSNGFSHQIPYSGIQRITTRTVVNPVRIIIGILILMVGIWFALQVQADVAWYAKLIVWCIPFCGLFTIIYDFKKTIVQIQYQHNHQLCHAKFYTINHQKAETLKQDISHIVNMHITEVGEDT